MHWRYMLALFKSENQSIYLQTNSVSILKNRHKRSYHALQQIGQDRLLASQRLAIVLFQIWEVWNNRISNHQLFQYSRTSSRQNFKEIEIWAALRCNTNQREHLEFSRSLRSKVISCCKRRWPNRKDSEDLVVRAWFKMELSLQLQSLQE